MMQLPLVLLPGMMCDARLFAPQIAGLSAGRTVVTADLSEGETVAALAQSVLETAPPEFALAGLSMGGIVAMEVLRQAPESVKRLALLDTNPLAETDDVRKGRSAQVTRANRGELLDMMGDSFIPRYLAQSNAEIEALCHDMAKDLGPKAFECQSWALRDRPDQCATLRETNVPTLILCGRFDQLCPLERHELMLGLMPHANFVIVENAGHLPTLEQPDTTTEALRRWLTI